MRAAPAVERDTVLLNEKGSAERSKRGLIEREKRAKCGCIRAGGCKRRRLPREAVEAACGESERERAWSRRARVGAVRARSVVLSLLCVSSCTSSGLGDRRTRRQSSRRSRFGSRQVE